MTDDGIRAPMTGPSNISYQSLGIDASDAWLADPYSRQAAFDTTWFNCHRDCDQRFRLALPSEIAEFGLPVGSMVLVHHSRQGVRLRQFWAPVYDDRVVDDYNAGIFVRLAAMMSSIFRFGRCQPGPWNVREPVDARDRAQWAGVETW